MCSRTSDPKALIICMASGGYTTGNSAKNGLGLGLVWYVNGPGPQKGTPIEFAALGWELQFPMYRAPLTRTLLPDVHSIFNLYIHRAKLPEIIAAFTAEDLGWVLWALGRFRYAVFAVVLGVHGSHRSIPLAPALRCEASSGPLRGETSATTRGTQSVPVSTKGKTVEKGAILGRYCPGVGAGVPTAIPGVGGQLNRPTPCSDLPALGVRCNPAQML